MIVEKRLFTVAVKSSGWPKLSLRFPILANRTPRPNHSHPCLPTIWKEDKIPLFESWVSNCKYISIIRRPLRNCILYQNSMTPHRDLLLLFAHQGGNKSKLNLYFPSGYYCVAGYHVHFFSSILWLETPTAAFYFICHGLTEIRFMFLLYLLSPWHAHIL